MNFSIEQNTSIDDVKTWLDVHGDLYAVNDWIIENPLLCQACSVGRLDIVVMLCKVGMECINRTIWENYAIECAVINGYLDIVKYLVEIHNVELHDSVYHAIDCGWIDILEYLLTLHIDLNIKRDNPLGVACSFGNIDAVNLLLKAGANPNAVYIQHDDYLSFSILDTAIFANRLDIIKQLVIYGVNIYHDNIYGYSPLASACLHGNNEIVHFLIGLGCDVNFCDKHGRTILSYAISKKNTKLVKLLLDNKAEVGNLADSMTDEMRLFLNKKN